MKEKISRREFLQKAGLLTAGVVVGSSLLNNKSYGRVLGANDRIRVAYAGVHGRGKMLIDSFSTAGGVDILYICDPEKGAREGGLKLAQSQGFSPQGLEDFRTILDPNKIDALAVAAPDHWHTAAGVLALKSGVNVYVEKPMSQNAAEGEFLIEAAKKYPDVVVQVGSQRRSVPYFQQIAQMAHEGVIGDIYLARGWYVNHRLASHWTPGAPVPPGLNWDLWQGPAPRRAYIDGVVHYDWHWTWHWGGSEAKNNGPHEMDLMAWMTQCSFPSKVTAMGGKFQFQDSWEVPDTLKILWECPGSGSVPGLMIAWDGHSRNGAKIEGQGRGTWFYGTKGSMQLQDGQCMFYDWEGKLTNTIKNEHSSVKDDSNDTASPGKSMDVLHAQNFLDAIRGKTKTTTSPATGNKAALFLSLGDIAKRTGRVINTDTTNGHIIGDKDAQALFGRTYEPGWEIKV